jgi:uncharacterized Ntn-hydrolase superfamily protein
MTFSIIGRCQETGQVGIAISSSSIAVGARCPWVRAGVGAVATQNITLPALGPQILDALEQGQLPPAAALDRVLSANGWSEYRQVTVIDSHGQVALFTGREAWAHTMRWPANNARRRATCCPRPGDRGHGAGLRTGRRPPGRPPAGSHARGDGRRWRSRARAFGGAEDCGRADLATGGPARRLGRQDPIGELDGLWQAYRPQMQDYVTRALNPTAAPSYGVPGDE